MNARAFIRLLGTAMMAVAACSLFVAAQENLDIPKGDDQTERIWKAHCVVPQTDDVKELRKFLEYQSDQFLEMNGHLQSEEDWNKYHNAENNATLEAANRIIEILGMKPGEAPPIPKTSDEYYERDSQGDVNFALMKKIIPLLSKRYSDPNWEENFINYVEELKKYPAYRNIAKFAEASLYGQRFNAAVFSEKSSFEEKRSRYEDSFEKLKRYCEENENDPYLKFGLGYWQLVQVQGAGILEDEGKLRKGTYAKPALEFYRSLYEKYSDAPDVEWHLGSIGNELIKYDILASENQLLAFQAKVEELKKSLEAELNEDSWQKVGGYIQIAEEMDSRNEATRLLLTTVKPIFEASGNKKLQNFASGHEVMLKRLAIEGLEFEFEAVLLDGKKVNLKDYRGKVVLILYWATWCGPCVNEMPMLKAFYTSWHNHRGVELISLSVDEDLDAWKAYSAKEELPWLNASEVLSKEQNCPDSREKYDINAFPTIVLIDANGKVVRAGSFDEIVRCVWKLFPEER